MDYKIQQLEKEKWQGHETFFCSYADHCYTVEIASKADALSAIIRKVPLPERKYIKYPMRWFETGHATVEVWGIIENEQLIAAIEAGTDNANRLYVSKLWVDENYRRQGIAARLMDAAKARAARNQNRAVYLETWSCNEHAIAFYLSQGFTLIGFDSCPFSNEDIEKFNVPLKLGYFLPGAQHKEMNE